jgi:hypothetical protein
MRSYIYTFISVLVASIGCSSSPPAPLPDESNAQGPALRVQQAAAVVDAGTSSTSSPTNPGAGFAHKVGLSRFSVGAGSMEKDEFGMHKFVGAQGVFATLPTGKSLSLANADAIVRQHAAPLPGGATAHNQAVRDYFVGAGLPGNQIASVDIMPAMTQMFDVASQKLSPPKLEYYVSMIQRQVAGLPVADSYAWARINQDGAVVEESVYWPEIPATAVADAQAFAAKLADSTSQQAYITALPTSKPGQLIIHHTSGEWTASFVAAAVYDVPDDNVDFGATVHYDSSGNKLVFPHEAKGAWGPLPLMPTKSR